MIMNQIAHGWIAIFRCPRYLARLLGNPSTIRMRGAAREIYSPCAVLDEEKRIQGLQRERFDGKEIAGQEVFFIMTEKRAPGVLP
jgi:hypothetical protein